MPVGQVLLLSHDKRREPMSRTSGLLLVLLGAGILAAQSKPLNPDPNAPRPIEALDTLFIEEMTWMEVRRFRTLKSGKTATVLVATGGVEQNGPYLATRKARLYPPGHHGGHRTQTGQHPGGAHRRLCPGGRHRPAQRAHRNTRRNHQPDRGHLPTAAYRHMRQSSHRTVFATSS